MRAPAHCPTAGTQAGEIAWNGSWSSFRDYAQNSQVAQALPRFKVGLGARNLQPAGTARSMCANASAMPTSQLSTKQLALVAQLDREVARARATGREPSEYFLDKCSAEAGDGFESGKASKARPWTTMPVRKSDCGPSSSEQP